jgi:CelD/BcsL family acetyltransferase involved in cellulose biosynthesis
VLLLDRAGLERCAPDFDACVDADPEVDRFCSRSDWILPFHDAFHPERELAAARDSHSFVALAAHDGALEPLEAMWGFASPLVGAGALDLLFELLGARARTRGRELLHLSGLAPRAERTRALIVRLEASHSLALASVTVRFVAALDDLDGFLSRRSPKFRASLRGAVRRVRAAGIELAPLEVPSAREADAAYARVLAVERRSWKSATENGVDRGPMREFYARMFPRLAARGALRVLLARRGGEDVGYLAGGIAGSGFRGLQFSFDERFRSLGLGNVLQLEMIERLSLEGVSSYDLGAQSAYKARWGERRVPTIALLARPRE